MVEILVLCLAIAAVIWSWVDAVSAPESLAQDRAQGGVAFAHVCAELAGAIWAVAVLVELVRNVLDLPHRALEPLDWLVAAISTAVIAGYLGDGRARFPLRALYLAAFTWIGMSLVRMGHAPGRFVVWAGSCDWTGFLLVSALVGWALRRYPGISSRLRVPGGVERWSGTWFRWAQAALAAACVGVICWILIDPAFDSMGGDVALFGLSGRFTGCPAALMLLGTTIVMAWQTCDRWRAAWQYTALGMGVLFSCSIGWARLDALSDEAWWRRGYYFLISISMMTLLTCFGLARVLPHSGDWLARARRAAPLLAALALLLATVTVARLLFAG